MKPVQTDTWFFGEPFGKEHGAAATVGLGWRNPLVSPENLNPVPGQLLSPVGNPDFARPVPISGPVREAAKNQQPDFSQESRLAGPG